MGNNRIKADQVPPGKTHRDRVALEVLKTVRRCAADGGVKVSGQLAVEIPGQPSLPMMICAQPSGGYLCWYLDQGQFHLYALVNENQKHIVTIPSDRVDDFQAKLTELQSEMGE